MASVTLSIKESFKENLKEFEWVNWSEIAREETFKKLIFENYIKRGELTDKEWEFCDMVDWHPVDELPLKKKFVNELKERKGGPFIKLKSVEEIFKK